jgi:uncharacterized membrane-anchored protein YitT (DUF2179 family)
MKIKIWKNLKAYLWIILGSFLTAIAINVFLLPYKIAPGGVSGLATVIHYLSGKRYPVGITMLILNIPLFITGIKLIGRKFILRTLFGTILLSFVIDITGDALRNFVNMYLLFPVSNDYVNDILLYSIFGGVLMGTGLGLIFRSGATTGGTDLAARIVKKFIPALSMGQTLLIIDACVVITAAVAFKSFKLGMYAVVALFIASKLIDTILEGVSFAKALFIISDKSDEISERILKELDRGVTALKGKGMYTGNNRQILFCVVHRRQIEEIKSIVRKIDENAFVILSDVREVLGEGFAFNEFD